MGKLLESAGIGKKREAFGVGVKGIKSDSRKVEKGDVFVAYKGVKTDGHEYIKQAIEKGAVAVIGERQLELEVPYFKVDDGRLAWAQLEAAWYDHPEEKLKLIGVTGTDGKTTTASLIYKILQVAGKKVGLLSTIEARIGRERVPTGLHVTSPDPDVFFKLLDKMTEEDLEYAVVEVTSHGLAQARTGKSEFEIGVITNIASEHLDFHGSRKEYRKTKLSLIEKSKRTVVNVQIPELKELKDKKEKIVLFDRRREIKEVKYVELEDKVYQQFEMLYGQEWILIKSQLLGDYNQENILAAAKVAKEFEIKPGEVQKGVGQLTKVEGRFQKVANKEGIRIVVDFAHTAQAMREVLKLVREELLQEGEKIIVVFGCAGERDASKRRPMGQIAVALANLAIITAEDPRSESMDKIFKKIEKGCRIARGRKGKDYIRVDDRREAIKTAIDKADKGDWVMVLGKGHEQSLNLGEGEIPWSDIRITEEVLAEKR